MRKAEQEAFFSLCAELFPRSSLSLREGDEVFLAYIQDSAPLLAGFLHLRPLRSSLYLQGIGVLPARRQMGIGRRLIALALRRAAARFPAGGLSLKVKGSNAPALRLYLSQGFMLSRARGGVWRLRWAPAN
ncbi:MAG: GNAT family N-acetyltransferase [Candidatus Marsarchaeota archaeon]|nr:GNAT family N-acetyltransferase [Candidatus Marsarchaeota archaeon]